MSISALCLGLSVLFAALRMSFAPGETMSESLPDQTADRAGTGENRRAVVIGSGLVATTLAARLVDEGGYNVIGLIDDTHDEIDVSRFSILGRRDDATSIVESMDVAHVFIAYAPTWQQQLAESLATRRPDISVSIVPGPYEAGLMARSVQSFGDVAVLRLGPRIGRMTAFGKRAFDIVSAIVGLLLFFPIFLVAAICIKSTSPGPVLFRQVRVGRYGREFGLYKLRTMQVDAESATGPVLSSGKGDNRLTRLGYWLRLVRLDELPQLWNVLIGEMSMVGPRPERPVFVEKYTRTIPSYARRHDVRPGIAGLAQLHGGYHTDARDKLRFDLIYATHQSVVLDISILLRTLLLVVKPQRKKLEAQDAIRK